MPGLYLVGVKGFCEAEEFPVEYGRTVTIGRSRDNDISLRNSKKWRELPKEERSGHREFLAISRTHCRIAYQDDKWVEVQDTSANGTFVDGKKVARLVISDIKDKSHEIRLGPVETFILEWRQ